MIGKLTGMMVTAIAAVCVATVIAAVVLIAFYAQSWKVNRERFVQAVAILQGKSPESLLPPPPPKKENDNEQPAYDQVLAAQEGVVAGLEGTPDQSQALEGQGVLFPGIDDDTRA